MPLRARGLPQICARACSPVTSGRLARAANGLQALRANGEDGGGGMFRVSSIDALPELWILSLGDTRVLAALTYFVTRLGATNPCVG